MPDEVATPKKSPRTIAVTLPDDIRAKLQTAADDADRDLGPFLSRAIKVLYTYNEAEQWAAFLEAGK